MTRRYIAGMLAVAALAGLLVGVYVADEPETVQTPEVSPIVYTGDPGNASYTNLYRGTINSVVSVHVSGTSGTAEGSGFVYDYNGHVVTNQHVVAGNTRVEVRFSQGDWRTGEVIGTDVYTDLAVIDIDDVPSYARPLPVADSDPVRGQPVAALGNPLGLEGSITHGIVSGVNRSMLTANNFAIPDVVQTDAPINPGNSGGPLVTLDGQVVGVNRAKQGDNIGFAISPALIQKVVPTLIRQGDVHHSYMGITSRDVSPSVAQANGLDRPRGVLIIDVRDGPSAGVLEGSNSETTVDGRTVQVGGDVIVSMGGTRINSQEDLANYLMTRTNPGETVDVTVIRDGEMETVELTLGRRPSP